ncbi:MAG: NAD(P)-dependent oxidoreductase [Mycobacterium sp.]
MDRAPSDFTPKAHSSRAVGAVGWVGLGRMGSAMVSRLLDAGVEVDVFNRTPGKTEQFVTRGAKRLSTLAEVAQRDVVFSMVTDDEALSAIHDSQSGLFSHQPSRRLSVWIDGSTVSPGAAQRAATAARQAGVAFVSAPVSGNPSVVLGGNAVFVISGDESGLDVADHLVSLIGRAVSRAGTATEAVTIKLCVNALLAITMQSLAEITVLADKAGVSRSSLLEFLNESAIGSPFTRYKTPNLVSLEFEPTFTAEGQRKDVRLALGLARDNEVPMPVLSATEEAYSRLIGSGLGVERDLSALVLGTARDAGHVLRKDDR